MDSIRINLDLVEGWGSASGRQVQQALQDRLGSCSQPSRICIGLFALKRADISFCRTSIIELAWNARQKYGFCLVDVSDADLLENWDAAAKLAKQPLFAHMSGGQRQVLGPQPGAGLRAMFDYVCSVSIARTSEAAQTLGLKIPNASNKLHELWKLGYVLRQDQSASSGGIEFEYLCIAEK